MSRVISLPDMGIILDGIYRNYIKDKIDQKSIRQLALDCGTSSAVILKVRKILAERHQLIIEGEKAGQKCYWNINKCAPNPTMLTEIYRIYTKDVKSRVKVRIKKERREPSIELAMSILRDLKWDRVILVKTSGYLKSTEEYDLTGMGE